MLVLVVLVVVLVNSHLSKCAWREGYLAKLMVGLVVLLLLVVSLQFSQCTYRGVQLIKLMVGVEEDRGSNVQEERSKSTRAA